LEYLRFGISDYGAETMLRDVHQVPAASYLEFSIDEPSLVREEIYWQPPAAGSSDLSFTEAAAELRRLFLRSVEWHLRSDVPVGAALSGGIDSSAIVMAMREIGGKSLDFSTFSYIAPGSSFNEQHHAEAVASAAGARIFKITATDEDLVNEMETLIDLQDEPFGSTSIYAQRRVFQTAAEEGITVMLDGQGTDEILAGYRHFFAARIASLLRSGKLLQAARLWRSTPSRTGYGATPAVWMHAAGLLLPPALRGPAMQISGQRSMPRWIDTAWFRERDADGVVPRQGSGRNTLIEQLQISLAETSLPALLRYEDRNSMASSVESRVPLLTTPLVEFVLSLPESYILSPEGVTKAVFRCALDGLVPNTILSRRDKIGFATPEADWLKSRQAWVAGILESDTAANIPAIRTEIMKKQWQDCLAGRSRFDFRFWRWINLILWAKIRNVHFE
jgi:asparagine synthase (glutamine-hydrolysing)